MKRDLNKMKHRKLKILKNLEN